MDIKDRIRVVCICKGIKAGRISDAIVKLGCQTVLEVNQKTGSGDGGCGATRCRPVIEEMLKNGGKFPKVQEQELENDDDFLLP